MGNTNKAVGFWAKAGVLYEYDQLKGWRAWLPECPQAPGYGRTKPQALADLKSLRARTKRQKDAEMRPH